MELSPFRIERFYARYEHGTRFALSSSDHLRERAERVPDRAGAAPPPGPRRPQPGHRAARRDFRVDPPGGEPDRLPRVTGLGDLTRYCERLAEAGVLLLPGSVYDQPGHVRIGFGRANMPDALEILESHLTSSRRLE
jgi:hypothetical protein